MVAANLALGHDAFSTEDWTPASWLDQRERNLHFYLTARRDVLVPLAPGASGTGAVAVSKGERIRIVTSGKWSEEVMAQICGRASFHIEQRWKDESGDYCKCNDTAVYLTPRLTGTQIRYIFTKERKHEVIKTRTNDSLMNLFHAQSISLCIVWLKKRYGMSVGRSHPSSSSSVRN